MAATTYPQGNWIGQEFANEYLPNTEAVIVPARATGDNTETVFSASPWARSSRMSVACRCS